MDAEEKEKTIQLVEFFRNDVGVPCSVPLEEILCTAQVKRYEAGEYLYRYGKTPNTSWSMA